MSVRSNCLRVYSERKAFVISGFGELGLPKVKEKIAAPATRLAWETSVWQGAASAWSRGAECGARGLSAWSGAERLEPGRAPGAEGAWSREPSVWSGELSVSSRGLRAWSRD